MPPFPFAMWKSGSFSPGSLSGLVLWNKNSTLSAGTIATWADSSGNGNTTAIAGSPTVATDAQYGGLLSIPFDGATQDILTASLTLGAYTVIQVARIISGDGYLWNRNDGTDVDYVYKTTGNTMQSTRSGTTSSFNLSSDWAFSAAPRTYSARYDGTHAGHGLRINGTGQALTDVATGNPGTATSAQQLDMLGGLVATVGEMLVYNRALTGTEVGQVETYLRSKFGHY